jgi:ATP-binding cassette subfamily F protein 3
VSHDRYFLKGLATKVLEMHDGQLTVYPGTFEEFLQWKEQREESKVQSPKSKVQSLESRVVNPQSAIHHRQSTIEVLAVIEEAKRGKMTYAQQKAARAERQKRERRLGDVEQHIATLEERKVALEALMADGEIFSDPQRARALAAEYEILKRELEERYAAWTELAEETEA